MLWLFRISNCDRLFCPNIFAAPTPYIVIDNYPIEARIALCFNTHKILILFLIWFIEKFSNFSHVCCLDRPSPSGEDGVIEGVLTRKHEWESTTKKASNRSWDKVIDDHILLKTFCSHNKIFLRCMSSHASDAFHSTKTRRHRRVSLIKHSVVNQPSNFKVQ